LESRRQALCSLHKTLYFRTINVLSQEGEYSELAMKNRAVLTEGQDVNGLFAIEMVVIRNSKGRWEILAQVPFNFTDMGANILIPDNAKFEQIMPWGRNATKADGTEVDPQGARFMLPSTSCVANIWISYSNVCVLCGGG
jgi:hypothetical protein